MIAEVFDECFNPKRCPISWRATEKKVNSIGCATGECFIVIKVQNSRIREKCMRKALSNTIEGKQAGAVGCGVKRYCNIRVGTRVSDVTEGKRTDCFPLLEGPQNDTTLLSRSQPALRCVVVKRVGELQFGPKCPGN